MMIVRIDLFAPISFSTDLSSMTTTMMMLSEFKLVNLNANYECFVACRYAMNYKSSVPGVHPSSWKC